MVEEGGSKVETEAAPDCEEQRERGAQAQGLKAVSQESVRAGTLPLYSGLPGAGAATVKGGGAETWGQSGCGSRDNHR